jgi:eukaryotic-like serine/threonine-protein kinase
VRVLQFDSGGSARNDEPMSDALIGTMAGNYRITSRISVGGMGAVYRAEHAMIGRVAAVKVLQQELTSNR